MYSEALSFCCATDLSQQCSNVTQSVFNHCFSFSFTQIPVLSNTHRALLRFLIQVSWVWMEIVVSTHEGLEKFRILPFIPETLLFSLTSPVPSLLSFFSFSPCIQPHTYSFVISSKHKERSAREHVSQTSCHPNDDKLAASPLAFQSSPDLAFMHAHSSCKWRSMALR